MAPQETLPPVLTSHSSPSPLKMNALPEKLEDDTFTETFPKDYGAQNLMASSYFL